MDVQLQRDFSLVRVWRQLLTVAAVFWALCLVLVALETTMGAHFVLGGMFFLSIPLLVACLIWVTKDLSALLRRRLPAVIVLGVSVLVSASLIVLIGLLAATHLKALMTGG